MADLTHPILGDIDLTTAGHWHGERQYAGGFVAVDLTIDEKPLPDETVFAALKRADDVTALDSAARAALLASAGGEDDAAVVVYADHHRDELPDEALHQIFGTADRDLLNTEAFLPLLKLVRIGIYPHDEQSQILLDYTISADLTDYLLSVSFASSGAVTSIEVES